MKMNRRIGSFVALVAVILFVIAVVVAQTLHQVVSVDLWSGATKTDWFVFGLKVNTEREHQTFSEAAVAAGFIKPKNAEWWVADTIKYPFIRRYESARYQGTSAELRELTIAWNLSNTPPAKRKLQAEMALAVLRNNQKLVVEVSQNGELLIASTPRD